MSDRVFTVDVSKVPLEITDVEITEAVVTAITDLVKNKLPDFVGEFTVGTQEGTRVRFLFPVKSDQSSTEKLQPGVLPTAHPFKPQFLD